MTHAKRDAAIALIAYELDEAWAECVDDACCYGQEIGPDVPRGADDWTDEEYEARTGQRKLRDSPRA